MTWKIKTLSGFQTEDSGGNRSGSGGYLSEVQEEAGVLASFRKVGQEDRDADEQDCGVLPNLAQGLWRGETERGDREGRQRGETERGDREGRQRGETERGDREGRQRGETERGDRGLDRGLDRRETGPGQTAGWATKHCTKQSYLTAKPHPHKPLIKKPRAPS